MSFFRSIYEQRPAERVLRWTALADRLTRFEVLHPATNKLSQPCWAPALFSSREASTAEHVRQVTVLVLDIDGGATIDDAWARCAPYTGVLHTSWRHSAREHRFRVGLPLARPVPGILWPGVWELAKAALRLDIDEKCRNANRRYLLPICKGVAADREVESRETGLAIDLLPLAASVPPSPPAANRPPSRHVVVPYHRHERAVRQRLSADPDSRRRLADAVGARVTGSGGGERAEHILCPACERRSVWFWIAPDRATRARCKHERTCGWSTPLSQLVGWP